MEKMRELTDGRGADAVLVAVPAPALVTEALAARGPEGECCCSRTTIRK